MAGGITPPTRPPGSSTVENVLHVRCSGYLGEVAARQFDTDI